MRSVLIIPARYASSRFPGKALAPIKNKPLIQWVYERAQNVAGVDHLLVATDDERIQKTVESFGGKVCLTRVDHESGTDRVFEAATKLLGAPPGEDQVIVNLQGDEPLIDVSGVQEAIAQVKAGHFAMATLACPIRPEDLENPNVVKVWMDINGRALQFSRKLDPELKNAWQHVGIYVFRGDTLSKICATAPTANEKKERLEQLRAMELGFSIGVCEVNSPSVGVDVPEDLGKLLERMK